MGNGVIDRSSASSGRASPALGAAALLAMSVLAMACEDPARELPRSEARVERLSPNPIIVPAMLPGEDGKNINGPSLIRVPDWLPAPLGRYYLYFAHHKGRTIRLAYADALSGPWSVYEPGTLALEDTVCDDLPRPEKVARPHVASPDVHVDEAAREIRMYFHCPMFLGGDPDDDASYRQRSLLARSKDGLHFEADSGPLGSPYFRVFRWDGFYYALGMPGVFHRSEDGLSGFVEGPTLFTRAMRHAAVRVEGDTLLVLYTDVGEDPERILISRIALTPDWRTWQESPPKVLLEPERAWEGANHEATPSVRGAAHEPVRQLRDPAFFEEAGETYLLYSVAGEQGIAIARLHEPE